MADQIGNFRFIRLEDPPQLVQEKLRAHTRPGTDGVTLHRLGTWAEPFEVTSKAQAASLTEAINLYIAYRGLVGQPPVTIVWGNHNFDATSHRFYVLDVSQPRCRRLILGSGPDGPYFAECECRWKLQPIKVA